MKNKSQTKDKIKSQHINYEELPILTPKKEAILKASLLPFTLICA